MSVAADPATVARTAGDGIICLNLTHNEVVAAMLAEIEPFLCNGAVMIDFGTTGYEETLSLPPGSRSAGPHGSMLPFQAEKSGQKAGEI